MLPSRCSTTWLRGTGWARHRIPSSTTPGTGARWTSILVPPLVHYLTVGWRAGVSPRPLFDLRRYSKMNAGSLRPDEDPLSQYLKVGWRLGQDPHPLFQVDHYLQTYPDVAAADVEPLGYYVRYGWQENRAPHPMFSTQWYRAARNVDLGPFEVDPR